MRKVVRFLKHAMVVTLCNKRTHFHVFFSFLDRNIRSNRIVMIVAYVAGKEWGGKRGIETHGIGDNMTA